MTTMDQKERQVRGRRSPNWAFMARMTIPCKDGLRYLVRLRLIATPWFGVYLHDIHEDDGDSDPHNHPWSFISIVLRGSYTERVYADPINARDVYMVAAHRRWSWHRMNRTSAHRIVEASPGLKTLIITGPRKASWGFFAPSPMRPSGGRLIDWKDYERETGVAT